MSFENKVAIVTGGGRGIGKAIAEHLLKVGVNVVIAEIDSEAGKATETELSPLGNIRFIQTNISNEESVKTAIHQTIELFGRLDILVNNGAISNPENDPIEQLSLESWHKVLTVNLTGAFLCTKYAVPHLRKHQGTIINIASTRALMSEPNTEIYSTAKGGLVALTHALANSLGPDIRVNCVSPGWIVTSEYQASKLTEKDHQQHPVGRVGQPKDITAMVVYLASEEATFITGINVVVDGGMTHKMIYI
ncbi:glucose 1-dehydrogenase [Limnoraphis robusta]|uniref:Glucose 1-dehydrogenase n=1 Tax=Limnoraphis robusta CCNP1315 TaxID=3110306 RepID=A0ABU5TTM9_9CYAN|nr:glucose 1-dehydrogenase [Limnoraphis robusta]MEA5518259.1 glucose 1-dehydrogenase [Limnoraphis robusta CCNP1315]MEA5547447.1 glucose 1-dehydrogenase [Limnoraphis robusta CCNP1324]